MYVSSVFRGLIASDDNSPHSFDEAVLSVLVSLLPSVVSVQWAGSLRWLALLITRLLPLDRNHSVAQQCVALVQQIAAEMSNRVNPYHLLLATRYTKFRTAQISYSNSIRAADPKNVY